MLKSPTSSHASTRPSRSASRIAQEAVTNAIRHSGTRRVVIRLGVRGTHLSMAVRDTGAGFDVKAALNAADNGRSLGLISMRACRPLAGVR
ncbi:MAG: ATP-binding protein [Isosphaeraceae bacterium]